ncbi:hypothetical protein SAMN05660226_01338 [Parapedobacter luteus]|uniref:Uncharacterized protein n=1 Tax=Parapedobacter luteus TaxID=623280 RepID=A0A1T5BBA3_9SPHI|nr:hypothetical protein [Parapedobacter luteus]SKB44319.1 hypothetical protein SAMN05660226_01338 [Parapedobacter luteus]
MKLKDIFSDNKTRVFVVTNQDEGDERNWIIEPTDFDLLPEEEIYIILKSLPSGIGCKLFVIPKNLNKRKKQLS